MTRIQTKIENAKTILHECIHAYLFVKAGNPATVVDFVKLLNTMYPTPDEQYDFMYYHMIPIMQKVLGEIRDLVTSEPKRIDISELKILFQIRNNQLRRFLTGANASQLLF
jgi:hypothetical protein